jgi:hypothetical protein
VEPDATLRHARILRVPSGFGIRISAFFRVSAFGLRISFPRAFGFRIFPSLIACSLRESQQCFAPSNS